MRSIVNTIYAKIGTESANKTFGVYMLERFRHINNHELIAGVLHVDPGMTVRELTIRELDLFGWYKKYWGIIIGGRNGLDEF